MYLRTFIQLLMIALILGEENLPNKDLPDKDLPEKDLPDKDLPEKELPNKDLPEKDLVQPRIFGGRPTTQGELGGFAVQIFRENQLTCTGNLLSERHILTAAHCLDDANYGDFHVVAGETDVQNYFYRDRNYLRGVAIHPDYDKYNFIADIAVLSAQAPMRGRGIGYIPLCKGDLSAGSMVTVAGWGKNDAYDNTLRSIRVPIVSKSECNGMLGRRMPMNVICAAGYNGKTMCHGDSGGPLIFNDQLCGINIWTYECGNYVKPDVFMSVYYYKNFIYSAMSELGD
ncbi:seminase [Drosophila innubila]|uniref:seminase n=1 Tax=Drosophila innubila TaxID=198719 RepID=UPI00148D3F96|nr:seminase [Drosophila innubila]